PSVARGPRLDPIADVLLANILARPLVEFAPYFATLVRQQGRIVLSGILREQALEVSSAYEPWFNMAPPTLRDDWARLEGRRKSAKVP
ncbi:MAG TPA: 50S ribosomal protein L11 methyltransferase, partial [Gammaproteobacteria bacterium]|nr:50S ribosomal protein L11 methyltransferase [Gammaproteobacteria bacterium]